ncbi:MAG: response regulator [Verrucomicrobiota bacterium]
MKPYWETKKLHEMNTFEWEALCDGCAKCCAHSGGACHLLDANTGRCTDYADRHELVLECPQLSPDQPEYFKLMPETCSYRLLHEGNPLPDWHPLVTGDTASIHQHIGSVCEKVSGILDQQAASDTAPAEVPQQADVAPANDHAAPVQEDAVLAEEESVEVSDQQAATNDTVPVEATMQENAAPAEEEPVQVADQQAVGDAAPANDSVAPAEPAAAPVQEDVVLTEEKSVEVSDQQAATDDTVPAEATVQENAAPANDPVAPSEPAATPAQEDAVLAEEESAEVSDQQAATNDTVPAEATVQENAAPAEKEPVQVADQQAVGDAAPANDHAALVEPAAAPEQANIAPVEEENVEGMDQQPASDTAPAEVPQQADVAPAEEEPVQVADQQAVGDAVPANDPVAPAEPAAAPEQANIAPVEEENVEGVDQQPGSDTAPAEVPQQADVSPAEEEPVQVADQQAVGDAVPANDHAAPAEPAAAPVQEDAALAEENVALVKEEGFSLTDEDIVERAEDAKKMIDNTLDVVETTNAASGFLPKASHEIRTALNGIVGMSQLMADMQLSAEQRNCINTILQSTTDLLKSINYVLDISKIEAGQMDIHESEMDLHAVCDFLHRMFRPVAAQKGIDLTCECRSNVPIAVMGDEKLIKQVLINLLDNALKFTHEGSVNLSIECGGKSTKGSELFFEVVDTGIGIDQEVQDGILKKTTETDGSGICLPHGPGLNLAVSKHLIGLMGGELDFVSEKDNGSMLQFGLFLSNANRPANIKLAKADRVKTIKPDVRVLLAEDNKVNQNVIATILRKAGCQIDVVDNGKESIAQIQKEHYDVLLMDCQMPVLDGFEATAEIRAMDEPWCKTPIVAITAHAMKGDQEKCIDRGMDNYLVKPVDRQELIDIVNKYTTRK